MSDAALARGRDAAELGALHELVRRRLPDVVELARASAPLDERTLPDGIQRGNLSLLRTARRWEPSADGYFWAFAEAAVWRDVAE